MTNLNIQSRKGTKVKRITIPLLTETNTSKNTMINHLKEKPASLPSIFCYAASWILQIELQHVPVTKKTDSVRKCSQYMTINMIIQIQTYFTGPSYKVVIHLQKRSCCTGILASIHQAYSHLENFSELNASGIAGHLKFSLEKCFQFIIPLNKENCASEHHEVHNTP